MKKGVLIILSCFCFSLSACQGNAPSSSLGETDSSSSTSKISASHAESGTTDCAHADENNDDFCDTCESSVAVTFDFYGINDLHGKFADSDSQAGVDELTTYLKAAKAENPNTVFLSSGDMWQGSSESNLTKGNIITEWMNEVGFASMTLGNHEYDWGETYIERNLEIAEFPFLAINVYEKSTNRRADYCKPSVTLDFGEVQIGIIGAIGDCYSSISADKVQDVYFKTGANLTSLVKEESKKLREEGVDYIVYSLHDGYGSSSTGTGNITDSKLSSYYDIALSKGYVDLVFEGHTHQHYVLKDTRGKYHLQDGGDNDGISHAEVKINFANGHSIVNEAEFISTSEYDTLQDDPIVSTLMKKYEAQITIADEILGYNSKYRSSSALRKILAQLYLEAGEKKWSNYDIVLGGGYMSARSPYNLYQGQVKYGDLMSIFPFDNELVLCSIEGADLKSQFLGERDNYYVFYGDYGELVKNSVVDGKTYYIVTDTYSSQYAPNRLTEIERYDTTTFARDLLAAYIRKGGLAG